MSFQQVSRNPIYLQVAEQIRAAIYSGQWPQGQPLPPERELSEMFGVSRASIREALRVLQAENLISADGKSPRTVKGGLQAGALTGALMHLLQLQRVELDDLVDFRCLIEGAALRQAARRQDEQYLDEARQVLEEMKTTEMSAEETDAADIRFHVALTAASGSEVMRLVMIGIRQAAANHFMAALRSHADPHTIIRSLAHEHEEILRAVQSRDGERAAALVEGHITRFYREEVRPARAE